MQVHEENIIPIANLDHALLEGGFFPKVQDTILGPKESNVGILFLHGFAGSNIEIMFLGYILANQGYRVLIPVLPGHGTNYRDLKETTADDWMKKATRAFEYLEQEKHVQIFIIGHSMGGTIALSLGAKFSSRISGIVTLAAPINFPWYVKFFVSLASLTNAKLKYATFDFYDQNIWNHPAVEFYMQNYNKVSFKSINEFFKILNRTKKQLDKVDEPILLVSARHDTTVKARQSKQILKKIHSTHVEMCKLEQSKHVIVIDHDRYIVADRILQFIRNNRNSQITN